MSQILAQLYFPRKIILTVAAPSIAYVTLRNLTFSVPALSSKGPTTVDVSLTHHSLFWPGLMVVTTLWLLMLWSRPRASMPLQSQAVQPDDATDRATPDR
jgi:hypothetical protein